MKKIENNFYDRIYFFTNLDKNDLEEIIQFFSEKGEVKLVSFNHEYDNLEELEEHLGKTIKHLKLSLKNDHTCELEFQRSGPIRLTASLSPETNNLPYKLNGFLERRENLFFSLLINPYIRLALLIFLFYPIFHIAIFKDNFFFGTSFGYYSLIYYGSLGYLFLVSLDFNQLRIWSINLFRKHQANFFIRHKEKLLWLLTGLLIGEIIKLLFNFIKKIIFS